MKRALGLDENDLKNGQGGLTVDLDAIIIVPTIVIGLPWLIMHYITKWKTAATITTDDETLLEELYSLAKRLDERMDTVERLVAGDHPDFRPPASAVTRTSTMPRCASSTACSPTRREYAQVNSPRTPLYRDKQNGKLMGVCSGIADYTGVNVLWVRLAFVLLLITVAPILLPGYFIAGHAAQQEARAPLCRPGRNRSTGSACGRAPSAPRAKSAARFRDIDRRLAEVETYYVTSNPRLSAEIERLR